MLSCCRLLPIRFGYGGLDIFVRKSMTYPTVIVNIFVALLSLAVIQVIRDHRRRQGRPYPPGPRPFPIIGNLLDIPKQFSWLAYSKFSQTYGDHSFSSRKLLS